MRQDTHDTQFTTSLDSIKDDLFGQTPDNRIILHRRDMVRGEKGFECLKSDPFLGVEFERRWIETIQKSHFLAIAGAIDKLEHRERYVVWQQNPYHYCLEILVERFVRWCSRHKFVGDVVVESRDKYADKRLKNAYRHFYDNGNQHITTETAQRILLSRELKLEPKEANIAGHQLADSLAHPVLKYLRCENLNEPVAIGFGARLVEALLIDKFARNPRNSVIKGWGHKWLPE